MYTSRQLAMACRCQLLTGSYEGASRSCDCENPLGCQFSSSDREALQTHPKVIDAIKRNWLEYEDLEANA